MSQAVQAILWDLDGVLFDTAQLHYQVWAQVLHSYGADFSYAKFLSTFGMKNQDFLPVLFGRPLEVHFMEQVGDEKESLFRQRVSAGEARVQPGVIACLQDFQRGGLRQAVASSAPQANVDALLDWSGLRPYFQAVVSSANLPGKPDPAIFLAAAQRLGTPPDRCVVIEDALMGIQAAHRADMRVIGVAATLPVEKLSSADWAVESQEKLDLVQLFKG